LKARHFCRAFSFWHSSSEEERAGSPKNDFKSGEHGPARGAARRSCVIEPSGYRELHLSIVQTRDVFRGPTGDDSARELPCFDEQKKIRLANHLSA